MDEAISAKEKRGSKRSVSGIPAGVLETGETLKGTEVPAVRNAVAILRYLQARGNRPATMSEIAATLDMNGSTCFNTLKTLEAAGFLGYDAATKSYRLGLGLIDLAASVDGHGEVMELAMSAARRLADQVDLTVVLLRMVPGDSEFVVIDKAEPSKPFKFTLSRGERFPANSPVLAKAYFAWMEESVIDRMIERLGLPAFTRNSITDPQAFKAELQDVRARGFATSFGEFYPQKHTIAAPIFDRAGRVTHIMMVVALSSEMRPKLARQYGFSLCSVTEEVTHQVGGSYPTAARREV